MTICDRTTLRELALARDESFLMKVHLLTAASAFEKLELEWNALLHRSVTDSLFLTWEWQMTWWQNLASGDLCIMTFREDHGALAGIAPMYCKISEDGTKALAQIGYDVSDYLDVIVAQGREAAIYSALFDLLSSPDFPAWDSVDLYNLPAASPTNTQLKALAQARGFKVDWREQVVSPVLQLPATWEDYLASLDKKERHEIRRKLRRIEQVQTRWYVIDKEDEVDAAVADFIELHKKSRPDKIEFMNARMQKFFLEMARRLFLKRYLQLAFLEVEGKRAASILNFVYGNNVLVYNSGYDPEKYRHLSPGVILFVRSIQDAIAAKRRAFDFLRGDEEYKYRLGAKNTSLYELHIRKRSDG